MRVEKHNSLYKFYTLLYHEFHPFSTVLCEYNDRFLKFIFLSIFSILSRNKNYFKVPRKILKKEKIPQKIHVF